MDSYRKWLEGIPYEVAFWQSYYSNKKRRKDLFSWSMYGKSCELDHFDIDSYIRSLDSNPKIIDVGCALSYMFGNIINNIPHDIIYIDPLSVFYNRILDKYKIDRPRIKFGLLESLSILYDNNSIDFIHIRNALDHSQDPFYGIIQCLLVLKKGGVLYLNHFRNEGENEGYRGFHQNNLDIKNNEFIIWNKDKVINVTNEIKSFAKVETSITRQGRLVTVITKTNDVPSTFYDSKKDSQLIVDKLIETIIFYYKFPNSFKFQFKRLYCYLGHTTMRLLPFSILNKIKKMAGKKS